MKKSSLLLSCSLACSLGSGAVLLGSQPSFAQNIDYGSLEDLIGESVTVGATGTPQQVSEVATDMTIITADEIRQSGSRSLPEILSRVPGLDVLQSSSSGYDVGVRGYQTPSQPSLLVLIDGRQVFIDDYSRTNWDNLPVNIDDIRQIEVVKGPASALFGSNAADGVINIITYSPLYDSHSVASLSVGTQGTLTGDATAAFKIGALGAVKLSVGGLTANDDSSRANAYPGNSDAAPIRPEHRYLAMNSVTPVTPNFQIFTEGTYTDSESYEAGATHEMFDEQEIAYSGRAGFSWQSPFGTIINDNYFNHTYANFIVSSATQYPFDTDLWVSKLEDQFKVGADHTFRASAEYRHVELSSQIGQALPQSPKLGESNLALSGTWLWQISGNLSWTNAARFDHRTLQQDGTLISQSIYQDADYSHDINTFSGNSGLVYKLSDADSLRATFGRGVQMPSLLQSGFNVVAPVVPGYVYEEVVGNPRLEPTIVQSYELGYDRKLSDISSTLKLSAFYQTAQDIVGFETSQGQPVLFGYTAFVPVQSVNIGNSHGFGGELELKGSQHNVRWDASYSLSRVSDDPMVATDIDYAHSAPQHSFRLNLGYTMDAIEFDGFADYVTSTDMIRTQSNLQVPTDGYFSLSGRIGYKINDRLTLALSGTNLTRGTTMESPWGGVERTGLITVTAKY